MGGLWSLRLGQGRLTLGLFRGLRSRTAGPLRMGSMRRVVVTGLGVVAPNGIGKDAFWSACVSGRSAVGNIRSSRPRPMMCTARLVGETGHVAGEDVEKAVRIGGDGRERDPENPW